MEISASMCSLLLAVVVGVSVGCQQSGGGGTEGGASDAQPLNVPTFRVDSEWPQLPEGWVLGDVSGVSVDDEDNVWLLHRPRTIAPELADRAAPPLVVFDSDGNFIRAWGGPGNGYEWPQREHGVHVDADGFVWVSGNNCPTNGIVGLEPVADDQLLKFTTDGTLVLQIGRSNQSRGNADSSNVHRAADMWVHGPRGEVFVADGYGNHRVIVFDAETGAFKRMWGAFGEAPVDDDHCDVVTPDTVEDPGPRQFSTVHSIRVSDDGVVYVVDRENQRVQTFTLDGEYLRQVVRLEGQPSSLSLSRDSAQRFLYVDERGGGTLVYDRKTLNLLTIVEDVEGPEGLGHLMDTDSRGNIYRSVFRATSTGLRGGVQKLVFAGLAPENAD